MTMIGRLWATGVVLLAQLLLIPAASAKDDFLPPERAYRYTTRVEGDRVIVAWTIEPGYYLYKKKMGVVSAASTVQVGEPLWPKGEDHTDEYFGTQEIYRGKVEVPVPFTIAGVRPAKLALELRLQGCADAGLCYPPQKWKTEVALPAAGKSAGGGLGCAARQETRRRRRRFPAARRSVSLRRRPAAARLDPAHLGDRRRLLPLQGQDQRREHDAERADRQAGAAAGQVEARRIFRRHRGVLRSPRSDAARRACRQQRSAVGAAEGDVSRLRGRRPLLQPDHEGSRRRAAAHFTSRPRCLPMRGQHR